jgi:hypothetical protein
MANYIPYYGKKLYRLSEAERKFAKLLESGVGGKVLADGVEQVRMAHARALKAMRAIKMPTERGADAIEEINQQIECWLAASAESIIEYYRTPSRHRPLVPADPEATT